MKTNEVGGWLFRRNVYTCGNYTITPHIHGALRLRAWDLRCGGIWIGRYSTLLGAQRAVARRQAQLEFA